MPISAYVRKKNEILVHDNVEDAIQAEKLFDPESSFMANALKVEQIVEIF
jgi:hypothetical protein